MSRILLDTSAYSAMRRNDERLLPHLQEAEQIALTPIVLGELLFGFLGGRAAGENRRLLRDFVDSPRVSILGLDEETTERYAAIRDYVRQHGSPIPVNDLWIAASAAQHGFRLLALDDHFKRVPQILLEYFEPHP
jgi:tRNA(fMet)-specific endonuclease VapC